MKHSVSSHIETQRYAAILQTAGQLFGEKGYQAVSLDEIARTAGVAKGLINYHFGSKEDLLAEILSISRARLSEKLDAIAQSDQSAKSKIRSAVEVYLEAAGSRVALFQMAISVYFEAAYSERIRKLWLSSLEENESKFMKLIEIGVAGGELKPVDSRLITHFVVGMVFEMIRISIAQKKPVKSKKLADEIVKVLFDGVGR